MAVVVQSSEGGAAVVVLDIPLLFEKELEDSVDAVLVVSAPAAVQRQRALAREGMTEAKLQGILARQVGPPTPPAYQAMRCVPIKNALKFSSLCLVNKLSIYLI